MNFIYTAPSQPPPDVNVGTIKQHGMIQVSWNQIPSRFIHGDLIGYKVLYTAVKIGSKDIPAKSTQVITTHPKVTNVTLLKLPPNTVYRIEVLAINENGDGKKSEGFLQGKLFRE